MTTDNADYIDQITGYVDVPGRPQAMEVHFEQHDSLVIRIATWTELDLKVGHAVHSHLMQQLEVEAAVLYGLDLASRTLKSQFRTASEVERYLSKKGLDPHLIPTVLDELKRVSLVDDKRYTELYLNQNANRMSRRELVYRLRQRGVAPQTVESVLLSHDFNRVEQEAVLKVATKYWKTHSSLELPKRAIKLSRYLSQHGFPGNLVVDVVDKLTGEEST